MYQILAMDVKAPVKGVWSRSHDPFLYLWSWWN